MVSYEGNLTKVGLVVSNEFLKFILNFFSYKLKALVRTCPIKGLYLLPFLFLFLIQM